MTSVPPPRLVLATHNTHKIEELTAILLATGSLPTLLANEVVGAAAFTGIEPIEDGLTFEANALIKARALTRLSGLPCVADDSGLAVDVLGGSPGIFSARWSGRHGDDVANLALLLDQLADIAPEHRGARFVCAAALVTPWGDEVVVRGELLGTLLTAPRGTGGFGYDPILLPEGSERSCAELSPPEKNAISHRGQAFRALAPRIVEALAH